MKKTSFYYRPSNTIDIEERLEDACMLNAMKNFFGDGMGVIDPEATVPKDALVFGRPRHFETDFGPRVRTDYWNDPGFLAGIQRKFHVTDLGGAEGVCKELHAEGKDVFLKSVELKLLTEKLPVGQDLYKTLGDMVWSLIDKPNSIMVQEFTPMREERRFAIIDRRIVSCSPVANHLTPLDRADFLERGMSIEDMHFEFPGQKDARCDAKQSAGMRSFVETVLDQSDFDHMIMDVAVTESGYQVIEYNPMSPGRFGTFGMDVRKIAEASIGLLPEDLAIEVIRRRKENDPWPVVSPEDPENEKPATAFSQWMDSVEDDLEDLDDEPFFDGL